MLECKDTKSILCTCRALSSPIRLQIVQLVAQKNGINLGELSELTNITNSAMTAHISALKEAGVLRIEQSAGRRGMQKNCFLEETSFTINILGNSAGSNTFESEIPIGSYVAYEAVPTCGMATTESVIGNWDDPRYFDDPQRINASILWMGAGYVEYRLPNYLARHQRLVELQISQEISSEAPGVNDNWPSDIHFSINGRDLGFWTCPGDFGDKRGLYSPNWWLSNINQYGLLKSLFVRQDGSYIDGQKISDLTIHDMNIASGSELIYRVSAPADAEHPGGLTLFGRGFGNYNQGITVRMIYQ